MTRMTPFSDVNRLFDDAFRSMFGGRYDAEFGGFGTANVQIRTDGDTAVVHADLPGFEPEEIDLRFDDGVLRIDASHEADDETEYRHRRVYETVRVPGDVLEDEIEASFHNGVLEVHFPRTAGDDESGRRIDID